MKETSQRQNPTGNKDKRKEYNNRRERQNKPRKSKRKEERKRPRRYDTSLIKINLKICKMYFRCKYNIHKI
jgi:hypothetical protein